MLWKSFPTKHARYIDHKVWHNFKTIEQKREYRVNCWIEHLSKTIKVERDTDGLMKVRILPNTGGGIFGDYMVENPSLINVKTENFSKFIRILENNDVHPRIIDILINLKAFIPEAVDKYKVKESDYA